MENQSEGGDFYSAYKALTYGDDTLTTLKQNRLPAATPVPAIPQRTGTAGQTSKSTGSGVASPFTESETVARQLWPEKSLVTTDGLIYGKYKPVKQITMIDANGSPAVFNFQNA